MSTNVDKVEAKAVKRTYVVCMDGSGDAALAFDRTLELSHPERKDEVYLVTVCPADVASKLDAEGRKRVEDQLESVLLDRKQQAIKRLPELTVHTRVYTGEINESLLKAAKDFAADYLVCGSRGLNAAEKVVMGSSSTFLSKHSGCPVLICRDLFGEKE